LKKAIAGDPSYFVAADALRSLARLDLEAALAEALRSLSRDSYLEEIRSAALEVIGRNEGLTGKVREEVLDRLLEWHRRGKPIPARLAAGRALARIGRGVERAYQALVGAAGDSNFEVRMAAFADLADFGDRRAIEVLQVRKGKEVRRLFRDPRESIDRAVKSLESAGDRSQLLEEIRRLRESGERLDRRVKALEERRAGRAY
jgi:HEAT repeat protein